MKLKKQRLKSWKIYAILDESFFLNKQKLLKKFHDLIESPIDVLQFRSKNLNDFSICRLIEKMACFTKKKKIPFIINDRPEIAFSVGADGVHLGKSDVSIKIARKILGAGAIIGKTIRSYGDLLPFEDELDYAAVGPVFSTPLKPGLKPIPSGRLRFLAKNTNIPLVAIGGINLNNVCEIVENGLRTVAFVRYGITQKNTCEAIKNLKKSMTRIMENKKN
ncbi:MAG: thiamine phosphate synthase [Candidatus Omnitrophota bacterium]